MNYLPNYSTFNKNMPFPDPNITACQSETNSQTFGLCDDPPPARNPAYIDEQNGSVWIAVVSNERRFRVLCTAIDNCIELRRSDGQMDKRCDCMLSYTSDALGSTIIFVELKTRTEKGAGWVKDAEGQLRASIKHFEDSTESDSFRTKRAYIANRSSPRYRETQMARMNQFYDDTGYVLRIENRLVLD